VAKTYQEIRDLHNEHCMSRFSALVTVLAHDDPEELLRLLKDVRQEQLEIFRKRLTSGEDK